MRAERESRRGNIGQSLRLRSILKTRWRIFPRDERSQGEFRRSAKQIYFVSAFLANGVFERKFGEELFHRDTFFRSWNKVFQLQQLHFIASKLNDDTVSRRNEVY